MARDVRTHLFDIITATQAVDRFTTKVPFEAYLADEILISAVERQCSLIGEAVTQLVKLEPNAPITDARRLRQVFYKVDFFQNIVCIMQILKQLLVASEFHIHALFSIDLRPET